MWANRQLADHFFQLAKIETGKQKGPAAIATGPLLDHR
jgi:hypothetical protein